MSYGTYTDELKNILGEVWDFYNSTFASGRLYIAVPTKNKNPRNPAMMQTTSYTEYNLFGLHGSRPQFNSDGSLAASATESQTIEFVIPVSDLEGLTPEQLKAIIKTADVDIKLEDKEMTLRTFLYDHLANCVVITFDKVQ
jgi:hypothetical protein